MNGVRIGLAIAALALDALCLILLGGVFALAHPTASAKLGILILGVVVAGNVPALLWSLLPARPREANEVAAGVFD